MFCKNWVVEVEDWPPSPSISSYLWCLPSHFILHSVFNMIYDFISIRKRRWSSFKTKSFKDGHHFPYNGPWPQDLISQKAIVKKLKQTSFIISASLTWRRISPHLRHQQSMLHYKSSTEAFEHEYASIVACMLHRKPSTWGTGATQTGIPGPGSHLRLFDADADSFSTSAAGLLTLKLSKSCPGVVSDKGVLRCLKSLGG